MACLDNFSALFGAPIVEKVENLWSSQKHMTIHFWKLVNQDCCVSHLFNIACCLSVKWVWFITMNAHHIMSDLNTDTSSDI
jgi:hypothetical protein